MKDLMLVVVLMGLVGCVSSESQVREAVRKNPKIVFDVIEENPEQFIDVVNRAAQKAQQKHAENQNLESQKRMQEDLKNPRQPKLDVSRRLSGGDEGKIVLVEYGDFQCPACGMGHEGLKAFKEKYKDQVQFYFKNMPLDFHPMAMPAARYFEAIVLQDREKARKFQSYIFENQRLLKNEAFLKKAAGQVGAKMDRLQKDLASEKIQKLIDADMQEFQAFGFTGTPVVIMNGVVLSGAQRFEDLEKALEFTKRK